MSTQPTSSSDLPPTSQGERGKQLDILCNKYIKHLLDLTSLDSLADIFNEQDIKDAELGYASEQMKEYAESQLRESFTKTFDEQGFKERLESITTLSKHTDEDYESVYTNSINQQFGEHGDKFHRMIPKPTQVSRAEMYRLKQKELERLQATRDSLRLENKAKMEELKKKKQIRQDLMDTAVFDFTPPKLDLS